MDALVDISRSLDREAGRLRFAAPVTHVYNPLGYAAEPHQDYLRRYGRPGIEVLLVGMNPGPFGMAQTGVPFGEVSHVREWMGVRGRVRRPKLEHPKRPILGFDCPRSEVSGTRLWGWAQQRFGSPEAFFERFFVANYCPLLFLEESGRNRTPDKLAPAERQAMNRVCDRALGRIVEVLSPTWVIGVGTFAERRIRECVPDHIKVGRILHPSPASPKANRGWAKIVEKELADLGVELPEPPRPG